MTYIDNRNQYWYRNKQKIKYKNFMSKWYLRYSFENNFLLRLLFWTGLLEDSIRRLRRRIILWTFFIIFSLLVLDDVIATLQSNSSEPLYWKANYFLTSASYVFSYFVWYAIRHKREIFTKLLSSIRQKNFFILNIFQTLILIWICSIPLVNALLLYSFAAKTMNKIPVHHLYGIEVDPYVKISILCGRTFLKSCLHPTWTNLVVLMFCLLCRAICRLMHCVTTEIERCSCEKFTVSKQLSVLKTESSLRKTVASLQKIFSVPCFLIFTAHFFVCVTSLGWIFELKISGATGVMFLSMFLEFTNAFGGLLACYWVAGGLPVAADAFSNTFRTKIQQRIILYRKSNALCFEKCLPELSNFELSGYGIIYFQRKSILALLAALLTYTLLINSWDK